MVEGRPETVLTTIRRWLFNQAEKGIYATRVLLIPFYTCLALGLLVYTYVCAKETIDLVALVFFSSKPFDSNEILVQMLAIVDVVMVANLVIMILIGSYSIFVRKISEGSTKRPQWLNQIASGSLKVKTSMSIVGVSSIHLLKLFMQPTAIPFRILIGKIVIHAFFIIAAYALAKTDAIIETTHQGGEDEKAS